MNVCMSSSYRTPLKPTLIVTAIYLVWAWPDASMVFAPVVAIIVYVLHIMFRWMTGIK